MNTATAFPHPGGAHFPSVVVGRPTGGGKPALDRGAFSAPVLAAKHGIDVGRYKTQLCKTFREKGSCPYASRCMFAHGRDELRTVDDNVTLKTAVDLVAPLVPPKASGHRRRGTNTKHFSPCVGGGPAAPRGEHPASPFERGGVPTGGAERHSAPVSEAAKSTCGSDRLMHTPAPASLMPAGARLMPPCLLPPGPVGPREPLSSDEGMNTSTLAPSAWRPMDASCSDSCTRYVHDPYTVPSPWAV